MKSWEIEKLIKISSQKKEAHMLEDFIISKSSLNKKRKIKLK